MMGLEVLRDISANLQDSPFLTIMADETTDTSNHEKVNLIVREVTQDSDAASVPEVNLRVYNFNSKWNFDAHGSA